MIKTGFEQRVKVQQIIENQVPEFIRSDSPKAVDFLKQYYISQEYQGGPSDIIENLDQYLKLDNLTQEVIKGETKLTNDVSSTDTTIHVETTKGFPEQYGLLKINGEIITYTGITTSSFTGCVRGFSGITNYKTNINSEELVFEDTERSPHSNGETVQNLSVLFLQEFYKKIKYLLTPGLENVDFVSDLNVNNFIKEARSFYQAKGTEESFRILFNVLYGINPKVIDLEQFLTKPSSAKFLRRQVLITEIISGDPNGLVGQTVFNFTDDTIRASVSEVEVFTRPGVLSSVDDDGNDLYVETGYKTYYKMSLFVGYDDVEFFDGIFTISPKTRLINDVDANSSVITVDSTIGFDKSGTIIAKCNGDYSYIDYTDKTVNQFLGCSGISHTLCARSEVTDTKTFRGYGNGDVTKPVDFRVTGVLSGFKPITDIYLIDEGERVYLKHVGEIISNPQQNKTYKQIFANTLTYNTSSTFDIKAINSSVFTLETGDIDRSSLKVGDTVDILIASTENVAYQGAVVSNINVGTREVTLTNLINFVPDDSYLHPEFERTDYKLRRKLETAQSTGTPIVYGNDVITTNVQNFYNDNDQYFYIASNSLPSYNISETIIKATIQSISSSNLQDFNTLTQTYSTIAFNGAVPFITGDKIYYEPKTLPISGLSTGAYFVQVLQPSPGEIANKIKLYQSRTLIDDNISVQFTLGDTLGTEHVFKLDSQKEDTIYPQKLLKKFPSDQNIKTGNNKKTSAGSIGILGNGVEILNYKSTDKIYYGPVESVSVYNRGRNYDLINPPVLVVTDPVVSTGTTCLVSPIIEGSVQRIYVDPQDFDISSVSSVTISGGNGSGAVLEPVVQNRRREIEFDSREITDGGGINPTQETITFIKDHYLTSGDAIVYYNNGNDSIGIASTTTYSANNIFDGVTTLGDSSVYYAGVVNSNTIKLYNKFEESISGINTVGLTTSVTQGIHKFKQYNASKTLRSIEVINPGSGYQYRKLNVKPLGISTVTSTINFTNHGFNDGDKIVYSVESGAGTATPTAIAGLTTSTGITSTTNYYQVIKVDDNSFKLANAGLGGTDTTNYTRRNYIKLNSTGTGYQVFSYPQIELNISVSYASTSTGSFTLTPYLRGEIIGTYVYENGAGYGSNILNFHKKPNVTVSTGTGSEFKAIVSNGRIIDVQVTFTGNGYTSEPDLIVDGNGVGAKLRSVVTDGKVTDVIIVNSGIGYDENTNVYSEVPGNGVVIESSVRSLTLNNHHRYGDEILIKNVGVDGLGYNLLGYYDRRTEVNIDDNGINHSPIIGWAYDGNPIYGPRALSDPTNSNSTLKNLSSGYILSTNSIEDRPSTDIFPEGFFVEDYKYNDSGDLDQYNGRYCKTPEFPNGVYAYFATIDVDNQVSTFPYFIGNTYRSLFVEQDINQEFDFNNSNLIRNTFPYKVYDLNASNDFLLEPNEIIKQSAIIESVNVGSVDNLIVNQSGQGYKVGDVAVFDDTETNGSALSATVGSIKGKDIENISTTLVTYQSCPVVWDNANQLSVYVNSPHGFDDQDTVIVSGVSTFVAGLTKSHEIGVTSETTYLIQQIPSNATAGFVTDIYVSSNFNNLSIGSTLGIGATEKVKVLNVFPQNKVIRLLRGQTGFSHTVSTAIYTIPNKFTIPVNTQIFDSKVNDVVYFNPVQSVGIVTNTGLTSTTSYKVGEKIDTVSIPSQSIYLPNHPFKTNQQVTFTRPAGSNTIAVSTSGNNYSTDQFNIPESGDSQTFFVINKSTDYIGLCTQVGLTTNTNGLYFVGFTSNSNSLDYQYFIQSNFNQVTAKVENAKATVAVSTVHEMEKGDNVIITLVPNKSVGIGTTATSVSVSYDSNFDKLLIDPVGFTSVGVSSATNTIQITSHNLKTGDKVFYNSSDLVISGLETGAYYVYRIDDDSFNLTQTYYDSVKEPPTVVSFASTGGNNQTISKINPQIQVTKNNSLVFNLTSSTLSGYEFKLFYDKDFNNEFVSIGNTTSFNIIGVGTVGVSTNASLTLTYNNALPSKLYYSLEKAGFISTSDKEVTSSSEILFVDSVYSAPFAVSNVGVGTTTFEIQLRKLPEAYAYNQSDTDILEYSTTSPTAKGGVDKMKINFGGVGYKKLPKFDSIISNEGINADIIPESSTIGRINKITIEDPGFDFSVDKTLRPEVFISPLITITNRNEIGIVSVTSGGSGYLVAPDLVLVNSDTGTVYENGLLKANLQGSSISSVDVVVPVNGLADVTNKVYAINNSNGVGITSCISSPTGIVTCILATPLVGFTTNIFNIGDKVFVEGIQKLGTTGTGFNSEDYNYQFFTVTNYQNTNPAQVVFSLPNTVTNAGVAVTAQNGYASIIKEANYPTFTVLQNPRDFANGEKLLTYENSQYTERDLVVTKTLANTLKVYGTYELEEGDVVVGKDSGTIATIITIERSRALFEIDYSLRIESGWSNDIGKLNNDFQFIPDNDYYQNLAYTVKSPIDFETLKEPVNRLLHTTGLKNFADTEILETSSVGVGTTNGSLTISLIDLISEKRVDTINNFDFGIDIDVFDNKSKYVKFKNKKFSDYIQCISNRVLSIDDISSQFNKSTGDNNTYVDLIDYTIEDGYNRFLVQIVNPNTSERQSTEIITLPSITDDIITVEKGSVYNTDETLGDISANLLDGALSLRFTPSDPYDSDYDIKVLRNDFNSSLSGINTQSVGFINLTGSNINVAAGSTGNIISSGVGTVKAFFVHAEVIDEITKERNYVELYVDHDDNDTNISQYYFDNTSVNTFSSGNFIGTFSSNISSGILSLDFYNNTGINTVLVRSKVVGFGTTSVGIGTYRFKSSGQPDGTEKTVRLQSNVSVSSGNTSVLSTLSDDVTTIKTLAKVSYGSTSALHQVLSINDETDTYTIQYPFLSIGSTSGIGTFALERDNTILNLNFYPDPGISDNILVQAYSEVIQTESDTLNIPEILSYGTVNERIVVDQFNGVNGNRSNATAFELNYEGVPIFEKVFNPSSTSVLDLSSGIFTIPDHFFQTGERLIYTPGSTFSGVTASSVGIGSTTTEFSGGVGIGTTDILPTSVFAIRINNDQFRLATNLTFATAGIGVTFTSVGSGNAHQLEMFKKMEKTIISIDGVVQSPLSYNLVEYQLSDNNGGQVGVADTYFAISGIATITPGNVLKIDDEYVKVSSVGLGTSSSGPITGIGTFNLIESERGFVGTSATSHTDGTSVKVYTGSFNIVNNKVHFTEAPKGNINEDVDLSNIPYIKSTFGGRVYLRRNYSTNQIYDDVSTQFTGIGQTYRLTVGGANTTGIETGSGILLINDIFQTPTTENNTGNNYSFIENTGISSVVFSGITTSGGLVISNTDVNLNQLPRGGIIVSLGSTSGLGFAPLVGASVTAVIGAGGSIVSVGLGTTDVFGSGYYGTVGVAVSDTTQDVGGTAASITATVGAGGTLTFNVGTAGTGYNNPKIFVSEPSYENLEVIGVSRLGIGSTTETGNGLLVTLDVGASSTTGIGSTLFEVKSFKIARPGYGFKKGDVFKPVGLVTDRNLASPLIDFELTVLETFTDSFSAWQFGELDYIDSISTLQNGSRTRFPLYRNGSLLSFEIDTNNSESAEIDLNALLLIFVNGVIQEPGKHYTFDGGTSFIFNTAPTENDKVSIFFYRGTRDQDSQLVNVNETIKEGDTIKLNRNEYVYGDIEQDDRKVAIILTSDKIETNVYTGLGVDSVNYKPVNWTKQKTDLVISNDFVYKSRDSLESLVYPTSRVIGDLASSSNEIFVDNAQFFNYEENRGAESPTDLLNLTINSVNALILNNSSDPVAAGITAVVSAAGTISNLVINDGGSGYTGASISVSIAPPLTVGLGIGTTATATVTVSAGGTLTTPVVITNPGFGYTTTIVPEVLAPTTTATYENITSITTVEGFAGIVTGINTTTGTASNPLALRFFLNTTEGGTNPFVGLATGYPVYIYETGVGSGVTSINTSDTDTVGIGTTFLNNVYIVNDISHSSGNAEIVCNVSSSSNVIGISTTGSATNPLGRFSWGRLSGFTRSSAPISIGVTGLTIDSGLSTFPVIQRRGYGLRDTGALRKDLG